MLSCCYALKHFTVPFVRTFSLLDFIGIEFYFIWLCQEVFVQWSFLWKKVPLQFRMSDYGLVIVAWDSSKMWLFCTVGIEAVLYDLRVSVYDVIIVVIEKYLILFFYDLAAMSITFINSTKESVAWNEAPCVVSPGLLMCGSITSVVMTYIHAFLLRFAVWFSMVGEECGDTVTR